jgi:hypothetical protein
MTDLLEWLNAPAPTWLVLMGMILIALQIERMWKGLGLAIRAILKSVGAYND